MELIEGIKKSLADENWISALFSALSIPDICSKMLSNKGVTKRYVAWCNEYMPQDYDKFLNGNDLYALRCAALHEGSFQIDKKSQTTKDRIDTFIFRGKGSHLIYLTGIMTDGIIDNTKYLIISIYNLCSDIIIAYEDWYEENKTNPNVASKIVTRIKIENGTSIIGGISIR